MSAFAIPRDFLYKSLSTSSEVLLLQIHRHYFCKILSTPFTESQGLPLPIPKCHLCRFLSATFATQILSLQISKYCQSPKSYICRFLNTTVAYSKVPSSQIHNTALANPQMLTLQISKCYCKFPSTTFANSQAQPVQIHKNCICKFPNTTFANSQVQPV